MVKKRKGIVLAVCICCILFPVTALAAGRASESWDVYAPGGGAYANASATYVKDTFANRGSVSAYVRVLGQDAQYFDKNNRGTVRILSPADKELASDTFYDGEPANITEKVPRTDFIRVEITIGGKTETKDIPLN